MKATTMLIAASFVALAGVTAIPTVSASPPFTCPVSIASQPTVWQETCASHTDVIEYCLTSPEVGNEMREQCIEQNYFGL